MTLAPGGTVPHEPDEFWEDEGRRTAATLAQQSAVVVVGSNPERAALVALGIAKAASATRRVALGDLVGDLSPLYAAAGGEDAFGISDCFREGLPLNDVARPSPECESLFILPAGTPPVATYDILSHERWTRLIRGFEEAGAFLVLVAPLDAPGLDTLVAWTGGIVAVDTPPQRVKRFVVLATVDQPARAGAQTRRRRPRPLRAAAAGAALLSVAAATTWIVHQRGNGVPTGPTPEYDSPPGAALLTRKTSTSPVQRYDTVRLAAVVNPEDSGSALTFAVEVVAANSSAGADSVLLEDSAAIAMFAATVVPVQRAPSMLWFNVIIGGWRDRAQAAAMLQTLRTRGILRRTAGVLVQVPYALVLLDHVDRERAGQSVREWRARGVVAYALVQDDGSVRVFAGAFENPAQAAPLAATVRDAGTAPVVAFRTGRPL